MRNATILLAVMAVLAVSTTAFAGAETWKASVGGAFETGTNWTSGNAPVGATDTANFNTGAATAYTVTFGGNVSNAECNVKTDKVIFDLGANTYATSGEFNVGGGNGEVGVLTLQGGGNVNVGTPCSIGGEDGGNPGGPSNTGNGTLTVQGGTDLNVSSHYLSVAGTADSTGKLVVTGNGSYVEASYFAAATFGWWSGITYNESATAAIEILDSGKLLVINSPCQVSQCANSTTTWKISGAGSVFQTKVADPILGIRGDATMDIENGGAVTAYYAGGSHCTWTIATESGGSGATAYQSDSTLNVGVVGTGTFTNGTASMYVGCNSGGSKGGNGLVHVGAGGTVTTGTVYVHDTATLDLDLGDWDINSDLVLNHLSTAGDGATLKFTFNATDAGDIDVSGNVTLTDATIDFTGSGLTAGFADIDFITAGGTITGFNINNTDIAATMTAMGFSASDWTLTVETTTSQALRLHYVPEPATMVLLGLGGIGVLLRRRKK